MIKQELLNLGITDMVICQCLLALANNVDLLPADKSQYFSQPCSIVLVVNNNIIMHRCSFNRVLMH